MVAFFERQTNQIAILLDFFRAAFGKSPYKRHQNLRILATNAARFWQSV